MRAERSRPTGAMTRHRRRFKQTKSLEARLAMAAYRLRAKAKKAPSSIEREALLLRTHQFEEGQHIASDIHAILNGTKPGDIPFISPRNLNCISI
ncbi:hypothetical protein XH89_14430 [Bradyrhizobium sp. CCBAU 53340]|nr:hypothetical protein XH89_14430 [Bradyrhizobium sp. CCBAU 53340]